MSTIVKEIRDYPGENVQTFEERQQQLDEISKAEKKEQKNSPFSKFVQMNNSKEAYKRQDWLMQKNQNAFRIWMFLINNMDSYNAVMVSYQVMTEVFEISRTTVYRAIKFLEDNEYIKILKSGTSNIYAVSDELVWNSWGSNKKYSKFSANIIISESEQTETTKKEVDTITKNQRIVKTKD